MSNNSKSNKVKGGSNSLPQYGKKGHKPRRRFERSEVCLDEIQTNDISYWNKTSGFNDVTKFNWDLIVGHKRNIKDIFSERIGSYIESSLFYNPPQVMSINFVMGPGFASSVDDPVNRALAHVMAKIRASLSTSNIGFETADLGILFAATSSIAAIIGYAKRVLESYTVWRDRNYVYPRALISAMGCNYTDIANNINKYAAMLNSAIDRYNNMSLLDCFDIYDRQYSMCHNIFADEDSQFGQLYIFKPENYYVYDDTSTPNKAVSNTFDPESFNDILSIIERALSSWYNSSDLYQINGTLLRAFRDAPKQYIPHYNIDDIITPVVDRAFLMQIMNCSIDGEMLDRDTLDITQEPTTQNYVIWTPKGEPVVNRYSARSSVLLRLFEEDVSNEDNMELTRLINMPIVVKDEDTDMYYDLFENSGSEIVTSIQIYTFDATVGTFSPVRVSTFDSNELTVPFDDNGNFITMMCDMQAFRYIPTIYVITTNDQGTNKVFRGTLGDVYNWMIYNQADWKVLNFVAFQSLWTPKNL
jgi:hypothetical protein